MRGSACPGIGLEPECESLAGWECAAPARIARAYNNDVTVGGIYALERIARDSPDDRAAIGEVLTAYVRGHAP
jgi:hypothetical protein